MLVYTRSLMKALILAGERGFSFRYPPVRWPFRGGVLQDSTRGVLQVPSRDLSTRRPTSKEAVRERRLAHAEARLEEELEKLKNEDFDVMMEAQMHAADDLDLQGLAEELEGLTEELEELTEDKKAALVEELITFLEKTGLESMISRMGLRRQTMPADPIDEAIPALVKALVAAGERGFVFHYPVRYPPVRKKSKSKKGRQVLEAQDLDELIPSLWNLESELGELAHELELSLELSEGYEAALVKQLMTLLEKTRLKSAILLRA